MAVSKLRVLDESKIELNDPPSLVWIRVQDAEALIFGGNVKLHDIGSLVESVKRHAFQEIPKFDAQLGAIKAGNGRIEALAMMERDGGYDLPRGLAAEKETGAWVMPMLVGTDARSAAEAKAYLIDSNNLTLMGAEGVMPWDLARMWDEEGYVALLGEMAGENVLPVSVDGDDIDALIFPKRPDFEGLFEEIEADPGRGTSDKDENWYYVEYYGDDQRWDELNALVEAYLKGQSKHELDNDFFYDMVTSYVNEGLSE